MNDPVLAEVADGPADASDRRARRVPFAVVDELSCYHDDPAEPNNVHLEVRVPGHVSANAFREATAAALAAQPRARARRAQRGPLRRRFEWEFPSQPDIDPVTVITWSDESELASRRAAFLACSPPLDSSPPVRLLLAVGPGQDCVILNAHHAAFDGLSCVELLRSVARSYAALQSSHHSEPTSAPTTARATLQDNAAPRARQELQGQRQLAAARQAARPSRRTRIGVTRVAADRSHVRDGYGYHFMPSIDIAVFQNARAQWRATVNDVLITALVVAIAQWNAAHRKDAGRIRITMPVNTREPGQPAAVGNLSRLAVISPSWPSPGSNVEELLAQVVSQTQAAKDADGPQVDPFSRAVARSCLPAAVKRGMLRGAMRVIGPVIIDTSLVSNLGVVSDPTWFGSSPGQMAFTTSAHMPRGLSVGAVTSGSRLQLCLRYRQALLDDPAAARLAELYADAITEICRRVPAR